jgi:hypothetical protein
MSNENTPHTKTTGNARLNFSTDFHSFELQGAALPVEVRRADASLAARTFTSEAVDNLGAGDYIVTARLPSGMELTDLVTISEDAAQTAKQFTATLKPDTMDESPNESTEVPLYFGLPQKAAVAAASTTRAPVSGLESMGGDEDTASLYVRLYWGNPLDESASVEVDTNAFFAPIQQENIGITVLPLQAPSNAACFLQVLQPGAEVLNIAVPMGGDGPAGACSAVIRVLPPAPNDQEVSRPQFSIDLHTPNRDADALLRYREQGLATGAVLDQSAARMAESLLGGKEKDQVAAAIGAYALLRVNDLERLHDWTGNLQKWFPWLPDGAAIRGEHLARQGEHVEALTAFLLLSERGLPLFSEGFAFAVDRLRLYLAANDSPKVPTNFAAEAIESARALLERLNTFAPFVEHAQTLLTFTGRTPDQPGKVIVTTADLDSSEFLDGRFDMTPHLVFPPATPTEQTTLEGQNETTADTGHDGTDF